MQNIQQNDEVRCMFDGRELVGIVNIVEDENGDAHVRVHGEGVVIVPTSKWSVFKDADRKNQGHHE